MLAHRFPRCPNIQPPQVKCRLSNVYEIVTELINSVNDKAFKLNIKYVYACVCMVYK